MGYGCIICDECLEVQAPDYDTEKKTEHPAEAAGSEEAAQAKLLQLLHRWQARQGERKPASPKKGKGPRNIRDGGPSDIVLTPCGHLFHRICIAKWFKDKNSMHCPSCRKLCKQSGLIRIFPAIVDYHPALNDMLDYGQQPRVVPAPVVLGPGPIQNTPAFPDVQAFTRLRNPNEDDSDSEDEDSEVQYVDYENNGEGGAGAGRPVTPPQEDRCTRLRLDCENTALLHQLLMQDFEDVQARCRTALENVSMQQATEQSYDDVIKTQAALIATLQKERDEFEEKLKTRRGGQKRPSGSKTKEEDSPSKRLRRSDDNPPAGGSNSTAP